MEEQIHIQNYKVHKIEADNDKPNQMVNVSSLAITGLPMKHGDIRGLIINTFQKVNVNIQPDDIVSIDEIHRNKKPASSNNNTAKMIFHDFFLVKLNNIDLKNNILTQMRKKKSLTTKELDVCLPINHPEQRIFIMHHLTKFQSQLYREAKNIKIKYNYKYLWCKDGNIYLRKSAESDVHRIYSYNDIFRLRNLHDDIPAV